VHEPCQRLFLEVASDLAKDEPRHDGLESPRRGSPKHLGRPTSRRMETREEDVGIEENPRPNGSRLLLGRGEATSHARFLP
jgi:hypothetical protein